MVNILELDPAAPIQFVINVAAGSSDAARKRAVIADRRGSRIVVTARNVSSNGFVFS